MHLAVRTLIHEHVLWKTSFMTSGLAERKERIFGTRRTPNTITVPINWRRDWGAGQDRKELVLVVSAALPILVFLVPSILRRLWEGPTKPDTLHTQHRRNQELTFPGLSFLLFTQKYRGRLSWLSRVLRKFFLLKSDRRALFQLLPRDLSNVLSSFSVSFTCSEASRP